MLTFSFNIFVFIIFIGIMIIGYTTGFVKEIKKIIHLLIPLIIMYLWEEKNNLIYLYLIKKLSFIKIPYFETILILILILVIIILAIYLQKQLLK